MRGRALVMALALAAALGHGNALAAVDAAALYNAGTRALARGDVGPAVAFLLAAHRIDPRARDIGANLAIARARVEESEGSSPRGEARAPSAVALSPAESWGASAALAALGALLLWAHALRPGPRFLALLGSAAFLAGLLLGLALLLRAREEARHPQAVVVAPVLDVAPAPEERPLSPYLLAAGEEVRLGHARGDLVEVRVGGNSIGWARRSGLWRVTDAARYTENSGSR
ncbi:MAG TPA: hypothetical protein VEU09_07460 [Candidatus Binatia bacterium]|nr:hypothetical protein [Candidatus Binatia bacterium]